MDSWNFNLASFASKQDGVLQHWQEELKLFRKKWHQIAAPAGFLLYGITFVARNTASYRNCLAAQQGRLQDVGFDLLPELPSSLKELPHTLTLITAVTASGLCIFQAVWPKKGIYITDMLIRFGRVMTVGHALRAMLYLSTSLPAPAKHCLPGTVCFTPPKNIYEILFSFYPRSCGDLVFSGHILTTCILTLMTQRYSTKILSKRLAVTAQCISWAAFIGLGPLIISARNRYTVDVLLGYVISNLLWREYERLYPEDS